MHKDKQVFVTFSAGVTGYRLDERIEDSLERADQALYEAKRTGEEPHLHRLRRRAERASGLLGRDARLAERSLRARWHVALERGDRRLRRGRRHQRGAERRRLARVERLHDRRASLLSDWVERATGEHSSPAAGLAARGSALVEVIDTVHRRSWQSSLPDPSLRVLPIILRKGTSSRYMPPGILRGRGHQPPRQTPQSARRGRPARVSKFDLQFSSRPGCESC